MRQRIYIFGLMLAAAMIVCGEETNSVANASTNIIANPSMNEVANATNNSSANAATNAAPAPDRDVVSFDEFKIITQRNIFDPNRRIPGSRSGPREEHKPTRIDYLNLVGAMSYEKGRFAFFDGSSSEYRKSVKPGDSIAGYKVADVTANKVTLENGDKRFEIPVGGQLKRVDEGEWKVNSNPESFAASTSSSGSSTSSSSSSSSGGSGPGSSSSTDEDNPILKRLLEQRRQGK